MSRFSAGQRLSRTRRVSASVGLESLERRTLLSGASPQARLLLQLRDVGAAAGVATMAAVARAELEPTEIPNLFAARGDAAGLRHLSANAQRWGLTRFVEAESSLSVQATPNDPSFVNGQLWGLNGTNGIGAPTAWDTTTGSTRVVVADIDTGVDYRHPDLYLNIWLNQGEIPASRRAALADLDGDGLLTFRDLNDPRNQGSGKIADLDGDGRITGADILRPMVLVNGVDSGSGGWADGVSQDGNAYRDDLIGWNFVSNTNDPMDDHGHGTHTSGTIAAVGNNGVGVAGVAWKAQIMPLKFISASGSGSDLGAAYAVRYAADNGARVSNNSYGGGGGGTVLRDAISYAAGRSHIFVAAAGNDGANTDASPSYPAAYTLANIVAVAATDSAGKLASFSNYGATSVDLAAPGVGIRSTLPNNGYASWNGTSMATPHVSGAAALVLSANPNWSADQVKTLLLNGARPAQALAGKVLTGGILDIGKALPPPPPPPTASEQVWVEDALPAGARGLAGGGDAWDWAADAPAPFSGARHHRSAPAAGVHHHYFLGASQPMAVAAGDTLFAYVYLDPADPPEQVLLQWHDGSWSHRAYWGANRIGWGADGTASRRRVGDLPAAGGWARLEVKAADVGLEGRDVAGMGFALYGGAAAWDRAGRAPA